MSNRPIPHPEASGRLLPLSRARVIACLGSVPCASGLGDRCLIPIERVSLPNLSHRGHLWVCAKTNLEVAVAMVSRGCIRQ